MSDKQDILLLFDRPKEPLFMKKGEEDAIFDVPVNYLDNRSKMIGVDRANRFGTDVKKHIPVRDIDVPDISDVETQLTRFENFSVFIPKHQELAGQLIRIFMGAKDFEDLKSFAVYARDRVNPYLFNYALSVALMHRPDTRELDVPAFMTCFPDKYVDGTVLQKVREEIHLIPDASSRIPIVIPRDYTATDAEPEHRLAYFREDLGLNLHHWHWHLVYPDRGDDAVVRKDRRGELFYFMHQQIIARYNFERLGNKLSRVERLDFRKPIPEAYFPKMDSLVSSRGWPARVANQSLSNLKRQGDQVRLHIDDLERWRDRIYTAIHTSSYMDSNGQTVPMDEFSAIDILGNMVEASAQMSPNPNFYGNLHNMGHTFISFIHDPDARHLETFGVMGDVATAMRDPLFYRWHAFVDDIFQEHKMTLPPYTGRQLNYQGVSITELSVDVEGGTRNEFNTFWMQSDVNLSRGMDFTPRGNVFARFTHLNHRPFTYRIQVNNSGPQRLGTCRIFLAPKNDETGRRWLLRDQRLLMCEMDRFTVSLQQGQNTITRRSVDSNVTIPFERTFRDLSTNRPAEGTEALREFNFCGCGWPQHMLVPRGAPEGMPCELFVMISNYEDDKVEQITTNRCNDAYAFCGIKDRLYPDRRPMGFPFDRMASSEVTTLAQFLTPNMKVQDVTIRFNDTTVLNPNNPTK